MCPACRASDYRRYSDQFVAPFAYRKEIGQHVATNSDAAVNSGMQGSNLNYIVEVKKCTTSKCTVDQVCMHAQSGTAWITTIP